MDSVMVPIWLTLSNRPLHAFFSIALCVCVNTGRVSRRKTGARLDALRVGDGQIVADDLDARVGGEVRPRFPVVLVERVLDRDCA